MTSATAKTPSNGCAELAGGARMYWERLGSGDVPLILVHGGFGLTTMFGGLLDRLAEDREVIAVELQGHGHTADIDRPFSFEAFGDDLAELIGALGHPQADLLGYSLGGSLDPDGDPAPGPGAPVDRHLGPHQAQRLASRGAGRDGPDRQRRFRAAETEPDVHLLRRGRAGSERIRHPDGQDRRPPPHRRRLDGGAKAIGLPTLLVYGDADSVPIAHAAEFYASLNGGRKDAGRLEPDLGTARLTVLPGATHYDILSHPGLPAC